ncbi:MAG UNVERIFIED_CONTAM: pilus assembly protein [Planctomycetaceae bacterium]
MKTSIRQQTQNNRHGAVTVEFAMVFPVILLMFVGSVEMASLHYARHTMGYAAYEAARKAAIPGGSPSLGQTAGMQQLNMVGLGTGAQVIVTQTSTAVTAEVRIPSSNFSWGPISYFVNFIAKERCTLLRE